MNTRVLKEEVYNANIELVKRNLVIYTWGNVSQIDRAQGIIAIKPRGIEYDKLSVEDMTVVDIEGKIVEGKLLPSVDLDIHLEIYKAFEDVNGIAHTHSPYATAFAQSQCPIFVGGSTHADHFYGEIPCLDYLLEKEIQSDYERNLGIQIVKYFKEKEIKPMEMCAVLAGGHGPFTWGKDGASAVEHSVILEEIAKMALFSLEITNQKVCIPQYMTDKHYLRKYGKNAYFYQQKE